MSYIKNIKRAIQTDKPPRPKWGNSMSLFGVSFWFWYMKCHTISSSMEFVFPSCLRFPLCALVFSQKEQQGPSWSPNKEKEILKSKLNVYGEAANIVFRHVPEKETSEHFKVIKQKRQFWPANLCISLNNSPCLGKPVQIWPILHSLLSTIYISQTTTRLKIGTVSWTAPKALALHCMIHNTYLAFFLCRDFCGCQKPFSGLFLRPCLLHRLKPTCWHNLYGKINSLFCHLAAFCSQNFFVRWLYIDTVKSH